MLASFWFSLAALLVVVGCTDEQGAHQVVRLSGPTMGTTYHITLVDAQGVDADGVQADIDRALVALNQQVSTYISNSEINRLKMAPVEEWVEASPAMIEVLQVSQQVSSLSGGAFDVTVRPLIDLWGFGPSETSTSVPSRDKIAEARSRVGYGNIDIDSQRGQIKRAKAVDLDLSAVAKGYGVDVVASLLEQKGLNHYLVEIGGEVRLKGHNRHGLPWRIAIERPQAGLGQSVYKALALTDIAMATSGDYRNYFESNGVRYSHTIDPRSGKPISHNLASVTVLHASAAMADALATAFSVLGAEQSRLLANSEGIAALFIIKDGEGFIELSSEAFKPFLSGTNSAGNGQE